MRMVIANERMSIFFFGEPDIVGSFLALFQVRIIKEECRQAIASPDYTMVHH